MRERLLSLLADKIEAARSGRVTGGTIACPECRGRLRFTIARDREVVSVFASCSACGAREMTTTTETMTQKDAADAA